jgi:hypothetical protein
MIAANPAVSSQNRSTPFCAAAASWRISQNVPPPHRKSGGFSGGFSVEKPVDFPMDFSVDFLMDFSMVFTAGCTLHEIVL